ncbi:hypothetical protein IM697_01870 [Streptomyces ferrugineus]|uniref:Uncharacterized protein n=1 Tax=Streptomyces ferrugineus TaxID=1413221 RepID=A0A7M2SP47_9ACTN|nr:hypothetical protein [Streptomyces ferrugineus]QOV37238.1 hypothetical protein IM697_01870 [Streptomyces ferrugineus]
MLRATWTTSTPGRRCALLGASAAVVCLGGLLAACGGGGGGDGYVATGAAGGPPRISGTAAAPTGEVTLVPLDEPERGPDGGGDGGGGPMDSPGREGSKEPSTGPAATELPAAPPAAAPSDTPEPAAPPSSSPAPSPPPASPATTPSPAKLTVSDPEREPTDKRWCEKVTLDFHNSGGTAVRSGTVTFGTHIIGALGIDWATIESTEKLPAPIGAGARKEKTWTVCVDAWRVPLGMRIETRDVTVRWE